MDYCPILLDITGSEDSLQDRRLKARFHYEVGWKAYLACTGLVNDCWIGAATQGDPVWLFQYKVAKTVSALTKWSLV